MLIVNADDWGRSPAETDAALNCFRARRITSVSAMVYMQDSERAANLARQHGIPVGLHLNLSQKYNGPLPSSPSVASHQRVVQFLARTKYAVLFYHAGLTRDFQTTYQSQLDEFVRLYQRPPTHVDGHQHKHLCFNMLFHDVIPRGQKVRRSFSFWPGEKSLVNRAYRRCVDRILSRKYRLTEFFFSLSQCLRNERLHRVLELARVASVELMTHPCREDEYALLMGEPYAERLRVLPTGNYHMV